MRRVKLKDRLNQPKYKELGLGYKAFRTMIERSASTASMARTFGVSYDTMAKWRLLYDVEKKQKK